MVSNVGQRLSKRAGLKRLGEILPALLDCYASAEEDCAEQETDETYIVAAPFSVPQASDEPLIAQR